MKGVFSAPGDYIYFKSQVPLHKIPIGSKQWRYYDFGPKVVPPLICLPGTAGTADVYYKQIMSLSMKGYRVISVDIPCVWNHHEWIQAFEKFLDAIDVHHIHLYGTSLGGFLAQLFAQYRPRRVKSLVLSNTFLETNSFSAAMPWAPILMVSLALYIQEIDQLVESNELFVKTMNEVVRLLKTNNNLQTSEDLLMKMKSSMGEGERERGEDGDITRVVAEGCSSNLPQSVGWTPSFLLKRYVLTGIHGGLHEPFIADSVDFVVAQVETLSKDDLASRLSLTVNAASVGPLLLSDSLITIIDTNDFCAIPQQLKDQVTERYPGARQAYLKSGGDFPFLSRPDEVTLHLLLHLRRVGVEARQDMVLGIPKDDAGGSSSDQNDGRGGTDDAPEDNRTDHGGPTNASEPPLAPEGPDSGNFENQLLSNAYLSNISGECLAPLMLQAILENGPAVVASKAILNFICQYIILNLLQIYLGTLYISLEV